MKKLTLKTLVCTLCASLALVGGLVLTGCSGTNPEEAIRQDITTNFDEIKNLDDAAMEEFAEELGDTGLESYGIETTELLTSMLDGFDYSIDPSRLTAIPPWPRSPSPRSPWASS